jgi:hypothetical protein
VTVDGDRPLVREVTDDEVAFFQQNGWAKLERLIEPDLAAELLVAAQRLMDGPREELNSQGWWETYYFAARDDRREPFASLVFSTDLGRAAAKIVDRRRLTDDPIGVRLVADLLTRKRPAGSDVANAATVYHTDAPVYPLDRSGGFSFWFALDEVPPERGSMRFLSGVHREGLLGVGDDVFERYPKLLDIYEFSPPLHLQSRNQLTITNSKRSDVGFAGALGAHRRAVEQKPLKPSQTSPIFDRSPISRKDGA